MRHTFRNMRSDDIDKTKSLFLPLYMDLSRVPSLSLPTRMQPKILAYSQDYLSGSRICSEGNPWPPSGIPIVQIPYSKGKIIHNVYHFWKKPFPPTPTGLIE